MQAAKPVIFASASSEPLGAHYRKDVENNDETIRHCRKAIALKISSKVNDYKAICKSDPLRPR
jgi:hypothetical protein